MVRPSGLKIGALAVCMGMVSGVTVKAAPPKLTIDQDIAYSKVGSRELKLDIARPAEGDGPFPAVLVIHGGAWRQGNKADVRPILPQFVEHGFVAISPEYRFCPQNAFPAQIHDVKAAVRWLKVNAKKYRIDPDRIGAMGFSAGGHLAMMLGLTSPNDGLEGDVSAGAPDSRVKAVVNYFGPTDLGAKDIPDICKPLVKDFLGGSPQDRPDAAAKASPLTFVSKDDAPVLTFQGTKDSLVPYNQAIKLAEAMNSAGVPGRVELILGADHGWAGAEMARTVNETFGFLDRYLKAEPSHAKP
ncbi:MAG TPA: alpha/beta hydrolase [Isosphaeraceae bacterium]|nr:alpha/beta hydrolase [Isosphaeraceae bacterium]